MKAVTEFAFVTLSNALKAQAAMTAEGKTAEEIQQSLGQTYKMEGEKLTYFMNALDVAGKNSDSLKRVVVISLKEGENAPAKATKVDELHYVPEFYVMAAPKAAAPTKGGPGGGRGGGNRGQGGGAPKSSPWGMSPEEIQAKKDKSIAAAKAAKS
jgi:hypothetical protein